MGMKRVLVAEDDKAICALLAILLAQNGCEVARVYDGADAIERLRETRFDAVVLDLMMPHVSGHVVVRYLEKERPDEKVVLVVSAVRESELAELERSSVVHGVIQKPFDIHAVARQIGAVVGN